MACLENLIVISIADSDMVRFPLGGQADLVVFRALVNGRPG